MHVPGEQVRRTRLVHTERFVIAVEVGAVIPDADPSELCYEPVTVELLREIESRANSGDIEWLKQNGKVYAAVKGT